MAADRTAVGMGSFRWALGDLECEPGDIPDFEAVWQARSPGTDFGSTGCATYRKMSGPVEDYVIDAVRRTLRDSVDSPADVDHIVFATSDECLALLPADFVVRVLDALGLVGCLPHLVSFQQCCSSLAALRHSRQLFCDLRVTDVVLVSLDAVPQDRDRLTPSALFSDAAVSCLLTRRGPGLVRPVSSAVRVDHAGMLGRDSFASRQQAVRGTLSKVLDAGGRRLDQVAMVFPTNQYQAVTLFNATAAGLRRERLHFTDTLSAFGHCGNSDWMINLIDYHDRFGIRPGEIYLAQSSAPGIHACALLAGIAGSGQPV